MAERIGAVQGALIAGAGSTSEAKSSLKALISAVEQAAASARPGFKGQAATAFQTLVANWQAEASSIVNELEQFEANLRAQDADIVAAEEEQQSAFMAVSARLQG